MTPATTASFAPPLHLSRLRSKAWTLPLILLALAACRAREATMAVHLEPQQSAHSPTTERHWFASGSTLWWAFYAGSSQIQIKKSTDQAASFGNPVTVDSTPGNNDVMLNQPLYYDQSTHRLHLLYGRNIDNPNSPAVLCHKYSDDQGLTWSPEHLLDSGAAHGNNCFYRVGIYASRGQVSVWYTSDKNSIFTTDGLWLAKSSDGGSTWPAATKQYAPATVSPSEPNIAADGRHAIVTWYDPGRLANHGGNIYASRTTDGGLTWDASPRLIAEGTFGRTRPSLHDRLIVVIGNSNWGGDAADCQTVRSTNFGDTWGPPFTQAIHSPGGSIDHPDVLIVAHRVFALWIDHHTTPSTYGMRISHDQGATYGPVIVPLTTGGRSDAPKLLHTTDYLIPLGYDSSITSTIWTRLPLQPPPPAPGPIKNQK